MARNLDKENEKINNGNRFIKNTTETTGVFLRDVDKLMHQYTNLRLSVYSQYKEYLPDPVSQEELKSYIDEQYMRLVKEYDINGTVDFPWDIKTKLSMRVYSQHKADRPDTVSQEELKSYTDEQFIRLVKEYDINGPVDFPGYIKTKSNYRVRHSYIKGEYRDRHRIFVPKNEFDIS